MIFRFGKCTRLTKNKLCLKRICHKNLSYFVRNTVGHMWWFTLNRLMLVLFLHMNVLLLHLNCFTFIYESFYFTYESCIEQRILLSKDLKCITDREVCCFMKSCKNSRNIDTVIAWNPFSKWIVLFAQFCLVCWAARFTYHWKTRIPGIWNQNRLPPKLYKCSRLMSSHRSWCLQISKLQWTICRAIVQDQIFIVNMKLDVVYFMDTHGPCILYPFS